MQLQTGAQLIGARLGSCSLDESDGLSRQGHRWFVSLFGRTNLEVSVITGPVAQETGATLDEGLYLASLQAVRAVSDGQAPTVPLVSVHEENWYNILGGTYII